MKLVDDHTEGLPMTNVLEDVKEECAFLGTPVCSSLQFIQASIDVGHVAAPQHVLDVPQKLVELSERILYSFEGFQLEDLDIAPRLLQCLQCTARQAGVHFRGRKPCCQC